ncbi:hypothetical protein ACFOQM_09190 [Paenibacillus sp. GCM10012307]|uniref:Uncharacterized protein n=1 Tax=Paenibacillus roseus TaxID=2798579 RepID=A0A934IY96_9BACL|nr:hypothetical protein [Paenibacillus roseus]MBJ6361457.1 hypothetical protein [Paenibacillus roseus]
MITRFTMLLVTIVLMFLSDKSDLSKSGRHARIIYAMLMLPVLYLGIVFVTELRWPNLDELLRYLFSGPVKVILASLNATQ